MFARSQLGFESRNPELYRPAIATATLGVLRLCAVLLAQTTQSTRGVTAKRKSGRCVTANW